MTAYLQNWTEGATSSRSQAGQPLEHAASDQYAGLKVAVSDVLYVSYLDRGVLHLMARLPVEELLDQREVEARFGTNTWEADLHAVSGAGDPIAFDLVVPADVVERLWFERSGGQRTRLTLSPEGTVNGQSLQRIRRLTPASAELLDEVLDENLRSASARPEGAATAAAKRAVELRAMDVVRGHFEGAEWTVEDVSAGRPYDFVCTRGRDECHVEVKGLSSSAQRVTLTANEVAHAETCTHAALCVVSDIVVTTDANGVRGDGGQLVIFDPWAIDPDALRPTVFSYEIPPR